MAAGLFWSIFGSVVDASTNGSSEPQTLSAHATGSSVVAACALEPTADEPPVGAGEPVTVAEQPVRATAVVATAARRRVRALRIADSLHGRAEGW